MRHIGNQAAFQLAVLLHRIGHGVEHVAQTSDLVVALHAGTRRVIAFLQRLRRIGDAANRGSQRTGEQHAHNNGDNHRDNRREDHRLIRLFAELGIGLGKQRVGAVHAHEHRAHLIAVNHDGRLRHVAARFLHRRRAQGLVGGIVVHDGSAFVAHLHVHGIVQGARRCRGVQRTVVPIALGSLVALSDGVGCGIGNALHVFARVALEMLLPHDGKHHYRRKHGNKGNRQRHQHDTLGERKVQPLLLARFAMRRFLVFPGAG